MRAKATLPWLRPAAYRRSSRTPRTRGAAASSPGIADTSEWRWLGRSCACCARAFFAWRFFAWGRPYVLDAWSASDRDERPTVTDRACEARPTADRTRLCRTRAD